jgi:nitronate monooxygenase
VTPAGSGTRSLGAIAQRLKLRLPVIGAPMFLVSGPELVIAQCKAGIVGAFPALNARPAAQLDEWLHQITEALAAHDRAHPQAPAAAYAVNQIVAASNDRLEQDLELCAKWKTPLIITSLGGRETVNAAAHAYGGLVFHDVISDRFARKAIERGADGLIAVCAGAGGATGLQSPFALVQEIRRWFDGPLALSGAIAHGRSILAAQAMGADFAYVGSAFIATHEANASEAYKQMVIEARADDIVHTRLFTGLPGNFLKASVARAGLDPDHLPDLAGERLDFASDAPETKPWRDIWGCGQGVAAVGERQPCAAFVARLADQYERARRDFAPSPAWAAASC